MKNKQAAEQQKMLASTDGTKKPAEFNVIIGAVERIDGNSIFVRGRLHDVADAMIIDDDGNIFSGEYDFTGKNVLVLYQYGQVISVKVLMLDVR